MPVEQLWNDNGELSATRGRWLNRDAIRELLRRGTVRFVIANPGERLQWIPLDQRFKFWKDDGTVHLVDTDQIWPDEYPNGKAHVASEWDTDGDDTPIVLLEVHH